jgi:hypothetical protein
MVMRRFRIAKRVALFTEQELSKKQFVDTAEHLDPNQMSEKYFRFQTKDGDNYRVFVFPNSPGNWELDYMLDNPGEWSYTDVGGKHPFEVMQNLVSIIDSFFKNYPDAVNTLSLRADDNNKSSLYSSILSRMNYPFQTSGKDFIITNPYKNQQMVASRKALFTDEELNRQRYEESDPENTGYKNYSFNTSDGSQYKVFFVYSGADIWNVSFGWENPNPADKYDQYKHQMLGGKQAFEVMTNVVAIIKQYMEDNPETVREIEFTAEADEKSRVRLYNKILERSGLYYVAEEGVGFVFYTLENPLYTGEHNRGDYETE